jgi:hypothetical protein
MVDVADGPDVHVLFRPLELSFGHVPVSLQGRPLSTDRKVLEPTTRIELVTSSLPRTRSTN